MLFLICFVVHPLLNVLAWFLCETALEQLYLKSVFNKTEINNMLSSHLCLHIQLILT